MFKKFKEMMARMKLAVRNNKSSVIYIPASPVVTPTDNLDTPQYIEMTVSNYTGATATLASFLCYRGAVRTREYLATLKYVGVDPIEIKFYKDPITLNLPDIWYNSWMVIAVTDTGLIRTTTFMPERCPVKTYDDMCEVLKDKFINDDEVISRWAILFVNHSNGEWDMTLSCVE